MADAEAIYRTMWESGQDLGLKLGWQAYVMQHTEPGFAKINTYRCRHEEPDMAAFFDTRPQSAF